MQLYGKLSHAWQSHACDLWVVAT